MQGYENAKMAQGYGEPAAARESDVSSAVRESQQLANRLADAVERMEQRLNSVTRPVIPTNATPGPKEIGPARVVLANLIADSTAINRGSCERLESLLDRLEV